MRLGADALDGVAGGLVYCERAVMTGIINKPLSGVGEGKMQK